MKNPIAFFPQAEYRISVGSLGGIPLFHGENGYQSFISRLNDSFCDDFLILAYVLLPNQCHFIVRTRALTSQETIREYSSQLRRNIYATLQFLGDDGSPFRTIVLPIPQEGPERVRILRNSIVHFHSLPVKMGLISAQEDWPYSSCHWIQNGGQIHPLSKWLNDFLLRYPDVF